VGQQMIHALAQTLERVHQHTADIWVIRNARHHNNGLFGEAYTLLERQAPWSRPPDKPSPCVNHLHWESRCSPRWGLSNRKYSMGWRRQLTIFVAFSWQSQSFRHRAACQRLCCRTSEVSQVNEIVPFFLAISIKTQSQGK